MVIKESRFEIYHGALDVKTAKGREPFRMEMEEVTYREGILEIKKILGLRSRQSLSSDRLMKGMTKGRNNFPGKVLMTTGHELGLSVCN